MMNSTCNICSSTAEILSVLDQVLILAKVKETDYFRIIIEETVALQWKDIKPIIKKLRYLITCVRNMVIGKVPRIQELIYFIDKWLDKKDIGPCYFSDFLQQLFQRDDLEKDIRFVKWIIESPSRCYRAFKYTRISHIKK